jgi:hypothetical protein
LENGVLKLQIFVDRSMLEAYANGRKSITTRMYPLRPDATGIEVWANGTVNVRRLEVWQLNSAYGDTVPSYYPETAFDTALHGELPNHSFETCDLTGWIVVDGDAFTTDHITNAEDWGWGGPFLQADDGETRCHLWGVSEAHDGDAATGILRSETFTLSGDGQISFLVSGGDHPDTLYIALVRASDGEILLKATGHNSEQYKRHNLDAAAYLGEELYIEVVDNEPGGWGHLNLDDVNVPTTGESDPYMEADILAIVEEPIPTDVESEYEAAEVSPTGTPTASTEANPLPVQWFVIGSVTVLIALGGGAYFLRRRIQRS